MGNFSRPSLKLNGGGLGVNRDSRSSYSRHHPCLARSRFWVQPQEWQNNRIRESRAKTHIHLWEGMVWAGHLIALMEPVSSGNTATNCFLHPGLVRVLSFIVSLTLLPFTVGGMCACMYAWVHTCVCVSVYSLNLSRLFYLFQRGSLAGRTLFLFFTSFP